MDAKSTVSFIRSKLSDKTPQEEPLLVQLHRSTRTDAASTAFCPSPQRRGVSELGSIHTKMRGVITIRPFLHIHVNTPHEWLEEQRGLDRHKIKSEQIALTKPRPTIVSKCWNQQLSLDSRAT